MPCRDYEDNYPHNNNGNEARLKKQNDRLARIACKAMTALDKDGRADFLLLEDDEVREWWLAHQEADRRAQEAQAAKQAKEEARAQALSKLTDEDKIILGLKKR